MFEGKEYVYEVYKTGSFSKAAEKLYITQPSLSAMVKKVEKKLGAPIFDRSTSPPGLTQCGERYIRCVERLMDMENEFGNYLNDLEGLRAGHLAIGGSNLFTSYILPPILQRFMKDYPGVEVNLVESNTKQLERQLLSGSLDLVIDNYLFSESIYERKKFSAEHLLLAAQRIFYQGVEFSVGKGPRSAFAELHIGTGIQNPGLPEMLHLLPALLHRVSPFQNHRTEACLRQKQAAEQSRRPAADDHRRHPQNLFPASGKHVRVVFGQADLRASGPLYRLFFPVRFHIQRIDIVNLILFSRVAGLSANGQRPYGFRRNPQHPGRFFIQILPGVVHRHLYLADSYHRFRSFPVFRSRAAFAAQMPASRPLDQAHCRLYPPQMPSTSRISPAKNSPDTSRDSMVSGHTCRTSTPPQQTWA